MATEKRFLDLATRLSVYGLAEREKRLISLDLAPNEKLVLSTNDEDLLPHMAHLRPESLRDLKRWIGVPDRARRVTPDRMFVPHPEIVREAPQMQDALFNYLHSPAASLSEEESRLLTDFVRRMRITVSIAALLDIYVARGATLVVDTKVQVLFARYITVEHTGKIETQGPFTRIDCAGLRALSRFSFAGVQETSVTHGLSHP